MPGVMTTLGLSKVAAAKAAGKKVIISKIAFGTVDAANVQTTTSIGSEDKVQVRVHINLGIDKKSAAFSGVIMLDSVSRRRLVGVYDDAGDLIMVDRITIPAFGNGVNYYQLTATISNYADAAIFDNSISYVNSFMSRQEAARIHRQSLDHIREAMPNVRQGQLIRGNSTEFMQAGWMLEEAMVVDSDQQLDLAKNTVIPMSEIFNTWYRFSHGVKNPPVYPDNPAELEGWKLTGELLQSTINSGTLIGFVSPNKVLDYQFEVTVSSPNNDDDVGGLVIAFNIENGIEHCLTALRSPGGWPDGWKLAYNRNQRSESIIADKNSVMKWGTGVYGPTPGAAGYVQGGKGWATFGSTRIRVERKGDIVRAWASDWASSTLLPESLIEINMGNFPVLSSLRKPASYGYTNWSQPAMSYQTHEMTQPSQVIFDVRDGKFYTYENGAWINKATIGFTGSLFRPNRFIYSPINKRTYFVNEQGVPNRVI